MKSKSELTDFYYKSLFPILKKLDEDRKNILYRVILVISFFSLLYSIALYYIVSSINNDLNLLIVGIIAYSWIANIIYKHLIKDYRAEFKNSVIRPLIQTLGQRLSYSPHMHVPQLHFNRSELFARPDKINGNDFVKGTIDSVPIQFSDLHAQKRHTDSKGRESWKTVFKGLFIVAEFNKNFDSKTLILPDTAQNLLGDFIGSWLQSYNFSKDSLVKMDNTEFEKEFVVYSNEQIESRYILSQSLMEKLLAFKKRSSYPVYFSFVDGNIHIAIYYNKDLFEPSLFKSLLEYKVAMEYIDTLHMAISIIDELKLNQKLWSKR